MDRYTREENRYNAALLRKKAQFKRRVRLKKIGAAAVLFFMFACVCLVIFGIGFMIYRFFDSRKMVEEPYSDAAAQKIYLVENVFTSSYDPSEVDPSEFAYISSENQSGTMPVGSADADYYWNDVSAGNSEIDPGTSSKGIIFLDAGHGGKDGGAESKNGILEKDIALSIALYTREALQKKGFMVTMSRTDDTYIGLKTRASMANEIGPLAMISVHLNSYDGSEKVSGIEAWTYKREGCEKFAQLLAEKVSESTGARNRGVSFAQNLIVTSLTNMPSVIIECGYMSDDEEISKLATKDYQKKVALGIANAVDSFVESYY